MATRPGVIRSDEVYTVREFKLRAGLGDFSYREIRAAGLRVRKVGRKLYVIGRDFLAFLDRQNIESGADTTAMAEQE